MKRIIIIFAFFLAMINILNAQTFVISPPDSFVFDCNQGVEYVTFSTMAFAIDTEDLILTCNGEIFDTSSERFSEVFLGVQFELPLESYMPNDTINLCLHNVEDSTGEWYYDSICWQYYMEFDNTPPSIEFIAPSSSWDIVYPGDTVDFIHLFGFLILDDSEIDSSSIYVSVEDFVTSYTSRVIEQRNDTLLFYNGFQDGLHFAEGDSMIDICIHVEDLYEPCPNALDTCYQIYLAPRDYCPCKAGFYMAGWRTIRDDVHTPIDMVVDSLSVKYDYFKLDDDRYVMDPCSMDVYYIQLWGYYYMPDTMINSLHDYVYNGGIVYIWSECTDIYPDVKKLLQRDDEWFLGMEPRPTHANSSTGGEIPVIEFVDHPIVPIIDISRHKNCGNRWVFIFLSL